MHKGKRIVAVLLMIALLLASMGTATIAVADAGAVTGLKVKQTGATSVELSWDAASGAAKYQVNQATASGGPWKSLKSITGTSTSVSSGLTAGKTYYFMVQGFTEGASGERYYGPQSNVVSVSISDGSSVGQATNLNVSLSGNTVKLTWNAAANATKYEVQQSTKSGSGFTSLKSVSGTSSSVSGLANGTYYFRIMPFKEANGKRVYGKASGEKSVKVSSGGSTPSGSVGKVTDFTLSVKGTTVSLSWKSAANATKYEVQRSTKSGSGFQSVKSVSGTSTTNTGLTKGATYYYRIMPFKEVSGKRVYGTASEQKVANISGGTNIGAVTELKVTGIGTSTVSLQWNAANNAVYYELRRSTSKSGPFVSVKSLGATKTSNSVPNTGTYYYQVVGYVIKSDNTRQYGGPSDVVKAVVGTPSSIGSISSIKVTKKNASTVTVSWSAADDANRYILYGSTTGKNFVKKGSTNKTSMDWPVGIAGGTFYFKVLPVYQVNGENKKEGGFSKVVSLKMSKVTIGVPTGLKATNNEKIVSLSWKAASNATNYSLYRGTSPNGTYNGMKSVTGTSTDNTLSTFGTYYYKVRGYVLDFNKNRVYGDYSSYVKLNALDGAVITSIVAAKINTINLEWNDVTFERDGFEVYRKEEGSSSWQLLPKTHIKGTPGGKYSFYDDTVVPGKTYSYSVATYVMNNGTKKTSKIGKNAKSLATGIAATTITAGYGISTTEGIFISWNDLQDIDNWQVQYSTSIDSGFADLAYVDESTFDDYEKGKLRTSGVYLKTTILENGVAYYIRVRAISTLSGTTVNGTWSKPRLVSAPNVTLKDVTTMKDSASVYLNVINNGGLYLYLPKSAKYWTNGDDITTQYGITVSGSNEVKPYQEITSQRYTFNDGTERKPSSSSMFDITFKYNGYSYTIQPGRSGESFWRITK